MDKTDMIFIIIMISIGILACYGFVIKPMMTKPIDSFEETVIVTSIVQTNNPSRSDSRIYAVITNSTEVTGIVYIPGSRYSGIFSIEVNMSIWWRWEIYKADYGGDSIHDVYVDDDVYWHHFKLVDMSCPEFPDSEYHTAGPPFSMILVIFFIGGGTIIFFCCIKFIWGQFHG